MTDKKQSKPYNEEDKIWHILTKTGKGTLSILKELDAPTARQIYKSLKPEDYPRKYINIPENGWCSMGSRIYSENDIHDVTILGPEGCILDPWKGVEPVVVDLTPEREIQKAQQEQYEIDKKQAQDKADELGLLKGLSYKLAHSDFRCSCCEKMKPKGEVSSYVEDGLKKTDPVEYFLRKSWNMHGSLWCSSCLPKEPKDSPVIPNGPVTLLGTPVKDQDQFSKYESVWDSIKRLFS
jgi:hypothetical protein